MVQKNVLLLVLRILSLTKGTIATEVAVFPADSFPAYELASVSFEN